MLSQFHSPPHTHKDTTRLGRVSTEIRGEYCVSAFSLFHSLSPSRSIAHLFYVSIILSLSRPFVRSYAHILLTYEFHTENLLGCVCFATDTYFIETRIASTRNHTFASLAVDRWHHENGKHAISMSYEQQILRCKLCHSSCVGDAHIVHIAFTPKHTRQTFSNRSMEFTFSANHIHF